MPEAVGRLPQLRTRLYTVAVKACRSFLVTDQSEPVGGNQSHGPAPPLRLPNGAGRQSERAVVRSSSTSDARPRNWSPLRTLHPRPRCANGPRLRLVDRPSSAARSLPTRHFPRRRGTFSRHRTALKITHHLLSISVGQARSSRLSIDDAPQERNSPLTLSGVLF